MDIVCGQDIKKELSISSLSFHHETGDIPLELAMISDDSFLCIINDESYKQNLSFNKLYYRFEGTLFSVDIFISEVIKNDSINLLRLSIDFVNLIPKLNKKLKLLFSVKNTIQKRKEERILVSEKLSIKNEIVLISADIHVRGSLRDISFSGVRCFVSINEKFYQGQKIVLNVFFTNPNEATSLLGIIVRYKLIPEYRISEIAIEICSSNFNYQKRISEIIES